MKLQDLTPPTGLVGNQPANLTGEGDGEAETLSERHMQSQHFRLVWLSSDRTLMLLGWIETPGLCVAVASRCTPRAVNEVSDCL